MGKLDKQLEDLRKQKLKAEFFKILKKTIGNTQEVSYKTIEKEVKDVVFAFLDSHIDMIENGTPISLNTAGDALEEEFTLEQRSTLKQIADRVLSKSIIPKDPATPITTPKPNIPPTEELATPDKISFALAHRSLGGKEVKVRSHGMATGTVTGIDAPYIVVNLLNGDYIKVPPTEIIL